MNSAQHSTDVVPTEFMEVQSEVLQLLMQVGYVACGHGFPSLAKVIFEGIAAVRPNSELPLIGLAFSYIHIGKLTSACDILVNQAARINPNNQTIKAVAAMIFRISGEFKASDTLLDEVIADGTDPQAMEFARQLKTEDFSYLRRKKFK
ncbi:MAG: hypothetical protein LBI34_01655 [Puniceicoccales bacterium]|jgi:hypothetical protein|nr:hypothetical protein [Puniceicoccales bacterium]